MVKEYTVYVFDCITAFEGTPIYKCTQTLKKFIYAPLVPEDIEVVKLNILKDIKRYSKFTLDITDLDFKIQLINRFHYPELLNKEEDFNEGCQCCF